MWYGWNIDTTYGTAMRFDNESNVSIGGYNPGTYLSLSDPTANILGNPSRSTVLAIPITSGGMVKRADGTISSLTVNQLPIGQVIQGGLLLAEPIDESQVPIGAVVGVITIGLETISIILLVVAILIVAGLALNTISVAFDSWKWVNYYRAQQAANDVLAKNMEVIQDETSDLNNDGTPDVRRVVWANGKTVAYALSPYGQQVLGTAGLVIEDEGTQYIPTDPEPPAMDWTLIIIAGVAVVALVLIVPRLSGGYSRESGPSVVLAR